jgi:hypothetical protein
LTEFNFYRSPSHSRQPTNAVTAPPINAAPPTTAMFGSGPASAALPAAAAQWHKFLERARLRRLDQEKFEVYAPIISSKHRLPPVYVADLLLRTTKGHVDFLDPRIPQYLQVLLKLKLVDTPSVLRALYKYSSSHTHAPQQRQAQQEKGKGKEKEGTRVGIVRWTHSYASEELIFWRLHKELQQGMGIRTAREAIQVVRLVAQWMVLFTDVAAAFTQDAFGAVHDLQTKEEMAMARQAFIVLVLEVCNSPMVLRTFEKPTAKGEFIFFVGGRADANGVQQRGRSSPTRWRASCRPSWGFLQSLSAGWNTSGHRHLRASIRTRRRTRR